MGRGIGREEMSHNMTIKQLHTAICKMVDQLEDGISTGYEKVVFLNAVGCKSCGYWRYSPDYGASMCFHPDHPVFRLPQNKTCEDHTIEKIEDEYLTKPMKFEYLLVLRHISEQEQKLIRIHKDMQWEIKRQKKRKNKRGKE